MIIRETNISDIDYQNVDLFKTELADKIISGVVPLFYPIITEKVDRLKETRTDIIKMRKKIVKEKKELIKIQKNHQKQKKIHLLVNRIEQLLTLKIDDDKQLIAEITTVLKKMNDLSDEKLEFYISEMMRIMTRKFSIEND